MNKERYYSSSSTPPALPPKSLRNFMIPAANPPSGPMGGKLEPTFSPCASDNDLGGWPAGVRAGQEVGECLEWPPPTEPPSGPGPAPRRTHCRQCHRGAKVAGDQRPFQGAKKPFVTNTAEFNTQFLTAAGELSRNLPCFACVHGPNSPGAVRRALTQRGVRAQTIPVTT